MWTSREAAQGQAAKHFVPHLRKDNNVKRFSKLAIDASLENIKLPHKRMNGNVLHIIF